MNHWDPRSLSARTYQTAGVLGVLLAGFLVVVGHVDPSPALDPVAFTVSEIAVSDRGGAIDVAMVALALASLALLRGARLAGLPTRGWPEALVWVWSAGLVVAALVPTDPPGVPVGPGGQVHRWASLVAFGCLPVAGFALARRRRARPVWFLSAVSAGCLLLMLYSATLAHRQLIGLAERLLIAAEVALLVVALLAAVRGGPAVARGQTPLSAGPAGAAVTPRLAPAVAAATSAGTTVAPVGTTTAAGAASTRSQALPALRPARSPLRPARSSLRPPRPSPSAGPRPVRP